MSNVEISTDKRSIRVHQAEYVAELLERFQMTDCRGASTPMEASAKSAYDDEIDSSLPYREFIGGLMYLAIGTRLDLAYSVGFLSRFLDKPTRPLWDVALRVLKYLKLTPERGLLYTGSGAPKLECYSDADFAGDEQTRRSTTSGSLLRLGNGAIGWISQRQHSVSLSSMESELHALSETVKTAIWTAPDLGYPEKPRLLVDNLAAIQVVKESKFFKRSKHIEVRTLFVTETYKRNELTINYCPTEINCADLMTKSLPKPRFSKLLSLAGLHDGNRGEASDHN